MAEKPGWRGLADDTLRVTGIGALGTGIAFTMSAVWSWWGYTAGLGAGIVALVGLAAFALSFVIWYLIALVGHRYLGRPANHPFHPFTRAAIPAAQPSRGSPDHVDF